MARQKDYDYFSSMARLADTAYAAAEENHALFRQYDPAVLPDKLKVITALESEGDDLKHEIMLNLARDFLPPLEVEDIIQLSELMDDVIDTLEDIALTLYSFNIVSIRKDVMEIVEIIYKCSASLKALLQEFKNYKKSSRLKELVIEINGYENEADKLYLYAMKKLLTEETDAVEIIRWQRMYDCLETCCDSFEDVADTIENIVMKNT